MCILAIVLSKALCIRGCWICRIKRITQSQSRAQHRRAESFEAHLLILYRCASETLSLALGNRELRAPDCSRSESTSLTAPWKLLAALEVKDLLPWVCLHFLHKQQPCSAGHNVYQKRFRSRRAVSFLLPPPAYYLNFSTVDCLDPYNRTPPTSL